MKLYALVFLAGCSVFIATQSMVFGFPLEPIDRVGFFDSLNVSLAGTWPFTWATEVASDSVRKLAFLGGGGGVFILDVSDTANPTIISDNKITTRDLVYDCYYDHQNQRLYVAGGYDGISVWNISIPNSPARILTYSTPGGATGICNQGNLVFVACKDAGFVIIDISEPNAPYQIGYLPPSGTTWTYKVKVLRDHAYIGDAYGAQFRVVNISDPSNPYQVGMCYPSGGDKIQEIVISGRYAFLACNQGGFEVVDITTPSNPTIVAVLPTLYLTMGVALSGDRRYVYTAERDAGVRVIDVSDPVNPYETGVCNLSPYYVFDVSAYGRTVLTAMATFGIVGANNPSNPILMGLCRGVPGAHQSIKINGDYVYLGTQGSLQIIDISSLQTPTRVGVYLLASRDTDLRGLDVRDNYLFLGRGDDIFQILDISNPANPAPLGYCYLGNPIRDLTVAGNYAYALADYYYLKIVDISDANSPQVTTNFALPGYGESMGIKVAGNCAYIANYYDDLFIVDVSDPLNPSFITQFNTGLPYHQGHNLDIRGNYIYLAGGEGGIAIIDVSDPNNPFLTGVYNTANAMDVVYHHDKIYIADGHDEVEIVDVSDPANPVNAGYYNNPYLNTDFTAHLTLSENNPGYFFAAYDRRGLHIYKDLQYSIEEETKHRNAIGPEIVKIVPNPAKGCATFIVSPVRVEKLEIYDVLGKRIRSLNVGKDSKEISIKWDGTNDNGLQVPSGIYFVKGRNSAAKFLFIE